MKLNKKEQTDLANLNSGAGRIARQRLEIIRGAARRQGIIADKLEDLKSASGKPFVEEKTKQSFFGRDYRVAVVREDKTFGPFVSESAYLCHALFVEKDPDSCGWVKGNPTSENYDDIGFLSGSAGIRHYCRICGKMVGEEQHTVS